MRYKEIRKERMISSKRRRDKVRGERWCGNSEGGDRLGEWRGEE